MDRLRRALAGWLRDLPLLTLGALLNALSLDLFLAPFQIAPGGISGLAIILSGFIAWPIGVMILLLNLPMLALGFHHLGRFRFLARTVTFVVLYSLGVDLLARWVPATGVTQDMLLNALYGGVVGGIGTGLVYRAGGTPAGTGIVSRIIQMRTGLPVSQIYLLTDGGVIALAGAVFGWERALYALLTLFIWGLASDYVLEGPSVVRTAMIVTDHPDPVTQVLVGDLGLGVTAWPAHGEFTGEPHTVLYCTVSRPEVNTLRTLVAQADPQAFIVIGHAHQARGGVLRRPPGSQPVRPPTEPKDDPPPAHGNEVSVR
jgi:uncharacterized membrane-anchored protein YitT (DUF2179 family)